MEKQMKRLIISSSICTSILLLAATDIQVSKQHIPQIEPIRCSNEDILRLRRGEKLLTFEEEIARQIRAIPYKKRFEEISFKIKEAQQKYKKINLPTKFNHEEAFKTWRYFDYNKARKEADSLVENGVINPNEATFFIRACKVWPLIKFYSSNAQVSNVDPIISYLVAIAESLLDENNKKRNKEGYFDIGVFGINSNPASGQYFQKVFSRNKWWIKGKDYTYTPNNILCGILFLRDKHIMAKCAKKNFFELTPIEMLSIYNGYTTGKVYFNDTAERHFHLTNQFGLIRLLPYVDSLTMNGNLIKKSSTNNIIRKIKK